jgi:type I restriction enzyme, S subunit
LNDAFDRLGNLVVMSSGKAIVPRGIGTYPAYGSNGLIGGADAPLFTSGCIVGRVGAYCGSVKLSLNPFWASDNTIVMLPRDSTRTSLRYLYYALVAAKLHNYAGGAAQPLLTQRDLAPVQVYHPPLLTQLKIAAVLSSYDDLIENNGRRIRLMEEMAERIYVDWFIGFRYPGHKNVPVVDSDLGPMPEDWTIGRVGDHASVIRGRSYRGADVVDMGGIPFINLKCVARDGGFRLDGIKRYVGEFTEAHKAVTGDIVMAVTDMTQERRIVARAARVPEVGEAFGVYSMDLVKIVPKDLPAEYILGLLRYSKFPDQVKAHANGVNVLHLHPDRISEYPSVFPPGQLARLYSDDVAPMQHLSDGLEAANGVLRASRDLLIPRLVSGEIDVSDLEIETSSLLVA